jgi:very-short-patch-repair endonuclease
MTDAERRLWAALRHRRLRALKFRRQHPLGPSIVVLPASSIASSSRPTAGSTPDSDDDARRTAWLESRGWRVLRFWNNDIPANPEDVQEAILQVIRTTSPEV